ncbi:MAG: hypothetical protein MUC87_00680 [Bacteroidia bacterium]|jgi:hypothetical protein|nr:hypothetical protein [Bacteroidia bacterium]
MKHLLLLSLTATLLAGSAYRKNKQTKTTVTPVPKTHSLVIGNPVDCGIDKMQIFPVGANYKPSVTEKPEEIKSISIGFSANSGSTTYYDRNASAEYVNNDENSFDISNILFYNIETDITHALFTDTVHILSFALHKEFPTPLIFYRVVKKDINNDSIYNIEDAVMLYCSTLNGENLTQLTPDNEQFREYFWYPKSNKLLIKTAIDADNSKSFTTGDETTFRSVDILAPALGREIFSKTMKDSLRKQVL